MLLIYGLGNHDPKYLHTKHNIGRLLVEDLARQLRQEFVKGSEYYYTKLSDANNQPILAYSRGYMNDSGNPLSKLVKYFKLDQIDSDLQLLLVQDDSDQQEGAYKLSLAGGSAGHRGIDSVYRHIPGMNLSVENIWRLKIGIRPPQNTLRSQTFVLSKLTSKDVQTLSHLSKQVNLALPLMLQKDWSKAQTLIHSARPPL